MSDDKDKKTIDIKSNAKKVGKVLGRHGETVLTGGLFTGGMLIALWIRDKFFAKKTESE